jgi:putative DNA primase/helicase
VNTNPTHAGILDAAIRWHAAGVVAVPVRTDGSKAPGLREWKAYQATPPALDDILGWFGSSHTDGVGVLTGAVSGNLEMLEFEGRAVDAGLLATLDQHADDNDMTALIEKLLAGYCERTPSGGIHLLYRVTGGTVERNTKLARTADRHVLAETRGEGGFVVVAPSFGRSHPTGQSWSMISGSIEQVPVITADERDQLWALVQLLDESPATPTGDQGEYATGVFGSTPGTRPGDDYANKTTWDDILTPHGWTRKFRMGPGYAWQRPGKSGPGISATTGQAADGVDRLYVFSSSTEFEPERPYNKFSAFALLHHGGDYAAAATQLAKDGFGTQPQQPITPPPATATISPPVPAITPPPGPTPRHLTVVDGSSALAPQPDPAPAVSHTPAKSEDGHSQALIAQHGDTLRYCPQMGRWLHWDGHRWHKQPAGGGEAREFAKTVARGYPDGDGWTAHKKRSLSNAGLTACLGMTETDPRVTVDIDALDAHPWELNTPGGIINLRTGHLRPADPIALHTRSTRVAPDPDADQTPWLDFLTTTFRGDTEIIGFIQRLMGYACVGTVREAILPVFYGQGANGKTVLLETVQAILGDYATVAPSKFLVQGPGQHATEIAALAGARLVIASETNEGERFDEAKVKQLTGGDTIKARFMRQDEFTFTPSHLLVMMTNHRPEVGSGGTSFWRRVREVPFTNVIPEHQRDTELKDRLVEQHGPAIMAWLAQGAALYAQQGLREPEGVRAATQAYEASTDTVARFVDDMVILGGGEHVKTRSSAVREAYETWCKAEGETPVAPKTLTTQLMGKFEIGMHKGTKGARFLTGMSLASATTEEPPATSTDPWGGS